MKSLTSIARIEEVCSYFLDHDDICEREKEGLKNLRHLFVIIIRNEFQWREIRNLEQLGEKIG